MKKPSVKKGKVAKVMGEFRRGSLKSSAGNIVKNTKQGLAIALSEAGMSKPKKRK